MLDDEEVRTDDLEPRRRWTFGPVSARVAVAEPDARLRRLLVAKLLDEGYEVYEADSASTLFEVISSLSLPEGIDLLIVDQALPGGGLDAVRELREGDHTGPLIVTAKGPDALLAAHARRLGVTLVSKPFALDVLSTLVRAALLLRPPRRVRPRFRAAP